MRFFARVNIVIRLAFGMLFGNLDSVAKWANVLKKPCED
jgi:hypothetical protein